MPSPRARAVRSRTQRNPPSPLTRRARGTRERGRGRERNVFSPCLPAAMLVPVVVASGYAHAYPQPRDGRRDTGPLGLAWLAAAARCAAVHTWGGREPAGAWLTGCVHLLLPRVPVAAVALCVLAGRKRIKARRLAVDRSLASVYCAGRCPARGHTCRVSTGCRPRPDGAAQRSAEQHMHTGPGEQAG